MEDDEDNVEHYTNHPERLWMDPLDFMCVPLSIRTKMWMKLEIGGKWKLVAGKLDFRSGEIQFIDSLNVVNRTEKFFHEYDNISGKLGKFIDALASHGLLSVLSVLFDPESIEAIRREVQRENVSGRQSCGCQSRLVHVTKRLHCSNCKHHGITNNTSEHQACIESFGEESEDFTEPCLSSIPDNISPSETDVKVLYGRPENHTDRNCHTNHFKFCHQNGGHDSVGATTETAIIIKSSSRETTLDVYHSGGDPDQTDCKTPLPAANGAANVGAVGARASTGAPGEKDRDHVHTEPRDDLPEPMAQTSHANGKQIHVFVTYAIDDQRHLKRVFNFCECLQKNGFIVGVDGVNKTNKDVIVQRYKKADYVIMCISPLYHWLTSSMGSDPNIPDTPQPQYLQWIFQKVQGEVRPTYQGVSFNIIPVLFTRTGANDSHIPQALNSVKLIKYNWPENWKNLLSHLQHKEKLITKLRNRGIIS